MFKDKLVVVLTIAVIGLGAYAIFKDEINHEVKHALAPNELYGVPYFGKMESTTTHMGYRGKDGKVVLSDAEIQKVARRIGCSVQQVKNDLAKGAYVDENGMISYPPELCDPNAVPKAMHELLVRMKGK